MARFAAFLRAINVGGHVVTMARLKELFEELGLAEVETLLASGNVVFDAPGRTTAAALERKIETALERSLGYDVATFLRSPSELERVVAARPFPAREVSTAGAVLYVGFLGSPPAPAARRSILAMATPTDDLHLDGREIYWLGRRGFANAEFSPGKMEKSLGIEATFRNITTVRKMAAKAAA